MNLIYNSEQYSVFEFVAEDGQDALHVGGYEIMDKPGKREIFIRGTVAAVFRKNVEDLIACASRWCSTNSLTPLFRVARERLFHRLHHAAMRIASGRNLTAISRLHRICRSILHRLHAMPAFACALGVSIRARAKADRR